MDIIDWCASCKEELNLNEDYVYYKDRYYHLECFLREHDLVLEIEE